jgi:hypothetical protein
MVLDNADDVLHFGVQNRILRICRLELQCLDLLYLIFKQRRQSLNSVRCAASDCLSACGVQRGIPHACLCGRPIDPAHDALHAIEWRSSAGGASRQGREELGESAGLVLRLNHPTEAARAPTDIVCNADLIILTSRGRLRHPAPAR